MIFFFFGIYFEKECDVWFDAIKLSHSRQVTTKAIQKWVLCDLFTRSTHDKGELTVKRPYLILLECICGLVFGMLG